jgi:hypothetical protein
VVEVGLHRQIKHTTSVNFDVLKIKTVNIPE